MNKILLIAVAVYLLDIPFVFSQKNEQEKSNSISSFSLDVDDYGNSYVAGFFEGVALFGRHELISKGGSDGFTAKYDANGNCVWAIQMGGKGTDACRSIKIDEKGNSYVAGYFSDFAQIDYRKIISQGNVDAFVAKYNPSGELIWIKTIGGTDNETANKLFLDDSGTLYIAGTFKGDVVFEGNKISSKGADDIFLIHLDQKGNTISVTSTGTEQSEELNGLYVNLDKSVYMTGNSAGNMYILKLGSDKVVSWFREYKNDGYGTGKELLINNGRGCILGDYTDTISFGNGLGFKTHYTDQNPFIAEFDENGNIISAQKLDADNGFSGGLVSDKSGNLYIIGGFSEYATLGNIKLNGLNKDFFISKMTFPNKHLWAITGQSATNEIDEAKDIVLDKEGNVYVVGDFNQSAKFGKTNINTIAQSIFIVKLSSLNGNTIWAKKAGEPDIQMEVDPNAKYIDYKAKLYVGKDVKRPLVDHEVSLKDSTGNVLEKTKTDYYGDFAFKSLNTKHRYDIAVGNGDSIPIGESVFIASQTGTIVKELIRNKNNEFDYQLLSPEMQQIALMEEEDPEMKLNNFLQGGDKEITINENIYYESGKWEVPEESRLILMEMVKAMKRVPTLRLEIFSYTDAIGDDQYNLDLSEKRANALVKYLISKKVPASSVTGKGFGETKIINRCANDVTDCSEKEHRVNRRTEFRFYRN